MTQHIHPAYVEGCYRCDLSRQEETDRLAAAVAQGHEDAVQAWPQEDGVRDPDDHGPGCGCVGCYLTYPAPVSPPAGEDVERVVVSAIGRALDINRAEFGGTVPEWLATAIAGRVLPALAALSARPVEAQGTDDGEVERLRERMPCDGGCDWNSGPEETCSLHGRAPRDIWDVVNRIGAERDAALARAEAAEGRERALREALADGEASDGYHTHRELYDYRMLYNAHAAHGWLAASIPVVKSWRHSDGEECFGGGWFIVTATLPTGQVSNHYRAEHWDLFAVPAVDLPPEYDGHTPADAADRLRAALSGQPVAQEGEA